MISNQEPNIRRTVALLCGQFLRWEKPMQKLRGESNKSNISEECRLVHQTAKEFSLMNTDHTPISLTGQPWYIPNVAEAASLISSKCVWFANLQGFSDTVGYKPGDTYQFIWKPRELKYGLQRSCKQHPFLRYTLRYWAHHYREVEMLEASPVPELQRLIDPVSLLYRGNTSFRAHWFMRMLRMTGTRLMQQGCRVPAVVFCAYNGHKTILPSLHCTWAVLGKHLPIVEWLLDNKAEIGEFDAWGRTPLHLAARRNNIDVLQCLLNHNANIFQKDTNGSTPIQGARDRQLSNHVNLLSEYERSLEGLQPPSPPQSQMFDLCLIREEDPTTGKQWTDEAPLEPSYEYHALNFPWEERNESEISSESSPESSSESSSERQSLDHSGSAGSSPRTLSRARSSGLFKEGSSVHSRGSSSDVSVRTTGTNSTPFVRRSSMETSRVQRRNQSLPDDNRHVAPGRGRLNEAGPIRKMKPRPITFTDKSEEYDSARRGSKELRGGPWAAKAILALDGGGVRSYSSILILRELMRTIIEREKSYPGIDGPAHSSWHPLKPIPRLSMDSTTSTEESLWLPCHYFDFVGGTSSGGILLGRLRMNIDDAIAEFENIFAKVLERTPPFDRIWPLFWSRDTDRHEISFHACLKELILRRLPKETNVTTSVVDVPFERNDEAACRTVVIGCRRSSQSGDLKPCLFRSYDLPSQESDLNGPVHLITGSLPLWQVARCALAIPRHLKPVQIEGWEYVDGSLVAHNPMKLLIDEVVHMRNHYTNPSIVISIGSSKPKKMIGSKSSSLDDLEHIYGRFRRFRFDVKDGLETMKGDEWRVKRSKRKSLLQPSAMQRATRNMTLDTIAEHTLAYISTDEVQERISQCAEILVEARRVRAEVDPDRWEKICYGSTGSAAR